MQENYGFGVEPEVCPIRLYMDKSFLLINSPGLSYNNEDSLSEESSVMLSPKRRFSFKFDAFEATVLDIDHQLLSSGEKDDEDSSFKQDVTYKASIIGKRIEKRGRPKGSLNLKKRVQENFKLDSIDQQETDRSMEVKETCKSSMSRRVHKLHSFWNNASMCYPFTFKKLYYAENNKNGADTHKICEDDLSGKLISYSDSMLHWE